MVFKLIERIFKVVKQLIIRVESNRVLRCKLCVFKKLQIFELLEVNYHVEKFSDC